MKKILIICGPTATGKTQLALKLAKLFNGELISADSRQVYKDMNIGTGKDIPKGSHWHSYKLSGKNPKKTLKTGFWQTKEGIRIWGYDLVNPKQEYSIAQYVVYTKKIINCIRKRKRLPILVGGSGLYIKAVTDGIPTTTIPRDKKLRSRLKNKTARQLFKILLDLNPKRARSMNQSDKKNPHRLVRAIEITCSKIQVKKDKNQTKKTRALFIGLIAKKNKLFKSINQRVEKRIDQGLKNEIDKLLKRGVLWTDPGMNSLGYKQWQDAIKGNSSQEKAIADWKKDERNYAKRQITWFKKNKRIHWFEISKPKYQEKIEKLVRKLII